MKVLITGGLGFIGSHLAINFFNQNNQVSIVDNLSRPHPNVQVNPNYYNYNQDYLKRNYPSIKQNIVDLRNKQKISQLINDFHPEIIIHAAGQVSAIDSVKNPQNDFENNVIGLFNTLESARNNNSVKLFIYLSTNKVYGQNKSDENIPKDENVSIDHTKHSPYGVSKLTGDLYVQEYGKLFDFSTLVLRMSCIYGSRQFGYEEQGWISHFIIQAIQSKIITIFGDGEQVRDILHIKDLCNLIEKYVERHIDYQKLGKKLASRVFNVGGGSNNTLSLLNLIDILNSMLDNPIDIEFDDTRTGDQQYYVSDIQKIQNYLGWSPKINSLDGIEECFNWVKKNKSLFSIN